VESTIRRDEIERKGISCPCGGAGGAAERHPTSGSRRLAPATGADRVSLGKRNIGIFSTDMDSFDFKMRKPEQVRQSVLAKLKKQAKASC
jgi:hypothetical protein